jgi:hypothetical protein
MLALPIRIMSRNFCGGGGGCGDCCLDDVDCFRMMDIRPRFMGPRMDALCPVVWDATDDVVVRESAPPYVSDVEPRGSSSRMSSVCCIVADVD